MNNAKKIRVVLGCDFVLFFLACSFWGWNLFGPDNPIPHWLNAVEREKIQKQLPISKKQWLSQNISSYEIDVKIDDNKVRCSASGASVEIYELHADITLRVENDVIISVIQKKEEMQPHYPRSVDCDRYYSYYTILNMFDIVDNTFSMKVWSVASLHVSFDSKYGFVSQYEIICAQCDNLHEKVIYSNFRLIEFDQ